MSLDQQPRGQQLRAALPLQLRADGLAQGSADRRADVLLPARTAPAGNGVRRPCRWRRAGSTRSRRASARAARRPMPRRGGGAGRSRPGRPRTRTPAPRGRRRGRSSDTANSTATRAHSSSPSTPHHAAVGRAEGLDLLGRLIGLLASYPAAGPDRPAAIPCPGPSTLCWRDEQHSHGRSGTCITIGPTSPRPTPRCAGSCTGCPASTRSVPRPAPPASAPARSRPPPRPTPSTWRSGWST